MAETPSSAPAAIMSSAPMEISQRLEQHADLAAQMVAQAVQDLHRAQHHGDMAVVTACVHDAWILRRVFDVRSSVMGNASMSVRSATRRQACHLAIGAWRLASNGGDDARADEFGRSSANFAGRDRGRGDIQFPTHPALPPRNRTFALPGRHLGMLVDVRRHATMASSNCRARARIRSATSALSARLFLQVA
jgi:hypothetical protein